MEIMKDCPKGYEHIKAERILLVLYTDKDGRRLVGGIDIDSGRDWLDVFTDCVKEAHESGRVVDVKGARA